MSTYPQLTGYVRFPLSRPVLTRVSLRALLSGLVAIVVLSCSPPDAPEGEYPWIDRDAGEAAIQQEAEAATGGELVVDGTWIHWHETSTCVELMSVAIESLTQTLMLAELKAEPGGVIRHKLRNCRIEQTPIVGVATTIPLSVIDSLEVAEFIGIVDATTPGAPYTTQIATELWGMHLTDPEQEELPTQASDPRVYDQDGDGRPGVTLILGDNLCTMAVIQRAMAQWKGTVQTPTLVNGTGYNLTTQIVMEASAGFCASQFHTWNPPNTARFSLLRVDGKNGSINLDSNQDGEVSCDEIRSYGSAVFNPREPDNTRCTLK